MADNIKIIGNISNILATTSRYSSTDSSLINSTVLKSNFGEEQDYIEYYIFDIKGNFLKSNFNYLNYKLPSTSGLTPGVSNPPNTTGNIQTTDVGIESTLAIPTGSLYPIIEIDPIKDIQDNGYTSGEFITKYCFFQNKISNPNERGLFVKEISPDRTEIRLTSTFLSDETIEELTVGLLEEISSSPYYVDYILNFGNGNQFVAINVALNKNPEGYEILFKLYQPLPSTIQEKSSLWVVKEKVLPYQFTINLDRLFTSQLPPSLRGPNFNIKIENQGTISTSYSSYSNLISSLQLLQSSSYNQIQNLLTSQSIDINIDYTDFNNFVFFGSAKKRVENFYTKVKDIETYKNFINTYSSYTSTTSSLQTNINQYSSSINNIIANFDGYEYYLYFESSSYTWPKATSNKPFLLLSTGSATVQTWYDALTGSAELYDRDNYDNLNFAVPAFIRDDENNQPFLTFLNMVGHYFDNIWIYLKSITDINLANNNLDYGISRDLVYQQLRSLGVKLYNSQAGNSVADYLIGANTGSSIFDNNFTITGSYLNNIPRADLVAELYKRIYHNLPLLLKTKGTVAGLDYLMTTFGIPNQTYYTITSGSITETFYTPTGSNYTASILSVKEFGGSLKSGLIRGYNNDKVRIVANIITGSVLSSELSLQTFPTASSAFRDDDLHYVDISFSPQTQIDTYASGAISSNNPTWRLDDYIGDPRQQYSSSYSDLDTQRKLYFETGVTGYPGFTGSLLDYNGFIRLIEYFDNSLFKMLADFVPERASLSTGVTINSPVLERNKAVYSVPNVTKENIKDANYDPIEISVQYGQLYNALQGNKSPFFTGELSGSVVDVNQYFEDDFNPYDGDWAVYNAQHTISESINLNSFLHSDWNVLLNNVSQSITSSYRKDIEYIWGTTGSILASAELQDSYLSLRSYNTSRYDGSKVTSLLYNTFTTGSYTGSDGINIVTGDKSFGKTPAIDLNSYKVGWVKNIPSQSLNFYDKTSINLKYLVDSKNDLVELSKGNLNLPEVQRIFQSGDPVVLSISDVKVPSNQTTLDGTKTIWKGGFSYDPILFRENNETLTFTHDAPISSSLVPLGIKAYMTSNYSYEASYIGGDRVNRPPSLTSDYTGGPLNYNVYRYKTNGTIEGGPMAYASYGYSGTLGWRYNGGNNKINFDVPSLVPTFYTLYSYGVSTTTRAYAFNILDFSNTSLGYNTEPNPNTYYQTSNGQYYYKVPRGGTYQIKGKIPFTYKMSVTTGTNGYQGVGFKIVGIVEKYTGNGNISNDNSWTYLGETKISNPTVQGDQGTPPYYNRDYNFIFASNGSSGFTSFDCDLDIQANLNNNDLVRLQFYIIDINNMFGLAPGFGGTYSNGKVVDITFCLGKPTTINTFPINAVSDTYFEIFDTSTQVTNYIYTSTYQQIPPLFTTSSINTLVFNPSASYLFASASTFTPTTDTRNLYSPVVDQFSIQKYDLIRIGSFSSPLSSYYEVMNISSSWDFFTNQTYNYITLDKPIISSSYNDAQNFAIFRPKPDETSVIINYKKQPGEVSQTILIPNDASETVKNAVGNIFKTLNTDLQ